MKRCVQCDHSPLVDGEREEAIPVGPRRFVATLPVKECPACGESYIASADLARFEEAVARALVEMGDDSPEAFRFLRKTVGLPAVRLAELLAVTPETISRWENGKRPVERRALALLQALVMDYAAGSTATLDRLRALAGRRKRKPRAVRVAL